MTEIKDSLNNLKIVKSRINRFLGEYYKSLEKFIVKDSEGLLHFKIKLDEDDDDRHFTTTATCLYTLINLGYFNKEDREGLKINVFQDQIIESVKAIYLKNESNAWEKDCENDKNVTINNCYRVSLITPFFIKLISDDSFQDNFNKLESIKEDILKRVKKAVLILIKNYIYNDYKITQWFLERKKNENKNDDNLNRFISEEEKKVLCKLEEENHSFLDYWSIKSIVDLLEFYLPEPIPVAKEAPLTIFDAFIEMVKQLFELKDELLDEDFYTKIEELKTKDENSYDFLKINLKSLNKEFHDLNKLIENKYIFTDDLGYFKRGDKDLTTQRFILLNALDNPDNFLNYIFNLYKDRLIKLRTDCQVISKKNNNCFEDKLEKITDMINHIESFENIEQNENLNWIVFLKSFLEILKETIRERVHIQIAYSNTGYLEFDHNQLAYLLGSLMIMEKRVDQRLLSSALDIIFKNKKENGGWTPGKAFAYSEKGDGEMLLYEMEPLAVILTNFFKMDELFDHLDKIQEAFEWLNRNRINLGSKTYGWAFSYPGGKDPRSWVTAVVYRILFYYSKFISRRIRKLVLEKYSVEYRKTFPINAAEYNYSNANIKRLFGTELEKLLTKGEFVSLLLFGPPGTGKTSLGYIVSDLTRFPLILLGPGDFLTRGFDDIGGRAKEIFDDLLMLEEAVVYVDEIDEFVLDRSTLIGNNNQSKWEERLITTAMLNMLDKVNKYSNICFIATTNHIEKIDPAIMRRGRFHYRIGIPPYNQDNRKSIIKKFIEEKTKEDSSLKKEEIIKISEKIAKKTSGFVYKDLIDLLKSKENKISDLKIFYEEVENGLKVFPRTIDNETYLNFLAKQHKYENVPPLIGFYSKSDSFCRLDMEKLFEFKYYQKLEKHEKTEIKNLVNFIKSSKIKNIINKTKKDTTMIKNKTKSIKK